MKYKTIIFDLDGTLLNTLDDITDAVNETFCDLNISCKVTNENVKECIGHGAYTLVEKIFAMFSLPNSVKDSYFKKYFENYSKHTNIKTKPYPNLIETLNILKTRGYRLGVISNKPNKDVETCLNFYFPETFDFWIGQVKNIPPKPNPLIFEELVKKYNINRDSVLYIGDMEVDCIFAKNINVDIAVFLLGYGKIEKMSGMKYQFSDYHELLSLLE